MTRNGENGWELSINRRAAARHWREEKTSKLAAMGFDGGWGTVAGQLKALCEA